MLVLNAVTGIKICHSFFRELSFGVRQQSGAVILLPEQSAESVTCGDSCKLRRLGLNVLLTL